MTEFVTYFNAVEFSICQRMNRLGRTDWIRQLFTVISRFGDGGFWILTGVVLVALHGTQAALPILHMAVTAAVGVLVYKALKNRLVRERPYVNHGDILRRAAPLDRYSFPSGHTLHAVSFTIMLWHFEPALLVFAAPFAVLVGASRVILGLHYPSDVFVGAAIGAALGSASLALY